MHTKRTATSGSVFSKPFLVLLLGSWLLPAAADIVDHWRWRNPNPFGDTMESICFGNGKFVAVGDGGIIHTSADGRLWDDGQRPVPKTLNRVFCVNGIFIAVGKSGTILTSADGVAWTQQTSGTTDELGSLAFGNG